VQEFRNRTRTIRFYLLESGVFHPASGDEPNQFKNELGFFRDFARKKGPLAGQHTQEVETLLPSPLFFRDLCG